MSNTVPSINNQESVGTPSKEWADNTLAKAGIVDSDHPPTTSVAAGHNSSELPGAYPGTPNAGESVSKTLENAGNVAAAYLPTSVVETVSNLLSGSGAKQTQETNEGVTGADLDPTSEAKPAGTTITNNVTETVKSYAVGAASVVGAYLPTTQFTSDQNAEGQKSSAIDLTTATTSGANAAENHEQKLQEGRGDLPAGAQPTPDDNIRSAPGTSDALTRENLSGKDVTSGGIGQLSSSRDVQPSNQNKEDTGLAGSAAIGAGVGTAAAAVSSKDKTSEKAAITESTGSTNTKDVTSEQKTQPTSTKLSENVSGGGTTQPQSAVTSENTTEKSPAPGSEQPGEHSVDGQQSKDGGEDPGFETEFKNPGNEGYEGYHPAELHPLDAKYSNEDLKNNNEGENENTVQKDEKAKQDLPSSTEPTSNETSQQSTTSAPTDVKDTAEHPKESPTETTAGHKKRSSLIGKIKDKLKSNKDA